MLRGINHFLRWSLCVILLAGFVGAIWFHLYEFFNYEFLKIHHDELLRWVHKYYFYTLLIYMFIYVAIVAFSLPVASLMTIAGGFLFGPIATLYVVVAATMGATILFWAVQTTIGAWFKQQKKYWLEQLKKGLQKNAFYYLLAVRLIPIFPFWAVNIAAGLLGVRPQVFVAATFIGIIPGTFIYVMIGNSLHYFFQTQTEPNLKIIFTPSILLPLLGLAVLAILPVLFKSKLISKPRE